ncbi:centromere protein C isoform X2 [Perognathus longimembris pacificus]|uniref:centromere protein C isoform X2 n=1 Tax=Perognathus longimembris pacificus TaxID=214514 RepID=UPI00201983C6|nr:centromere protein C isoform X2 [Perognathus longimembris pacificus]
MASSVARAERGGNAAHSGLEYLKNDYRRRFCRPFRVPEIHTKKGQDMLEILQDCFEEKNFVNDFLTNSAESMHYSPAKVKGSYTCSSGKKSQTPLPKSVPDSSRKKEASLQGIVESTETAARPVQVHEVQNMLAVDVGSKDTPDTKKKSSNKLSGHYSKSDEEFYMSVGSSAIPLDGKTSIVQSASPSAAQKKEPYNFIHSANRLSSSTGLSSLKTKKRLTIEGKDIIKNVEVENKVPEAIDKISEGQEENNSAETSQREIQNLECKNQPQTKKSFSTLFLETVRRKSESGPIVRYTVTTPSHSSPNDKTLEDEFIIDDLDRSLASQSWITIPRKGAPLKHHTVSPFENSSLIQDNKSRGKQKSVSPKTLTSDKHSYKAPLVEKSQPSGEKIVGMSSALIDELEKNHTSTKYKMCSNNAEKHPSSKKTVQQKQRRSLRASVVEEQYDKGQCEDENRNVSHIAQAKLKRNSGRNAEDCEETRNGHISEKQTSPVGNKKKKGSTKKEESKKKHFSNGPKNRFAPEEVTFTVTRSRRLSRHPSNWWVVKAEESPTHGNSPIRNEFSMYYSSRQKPAKKTNQSSKNVGKKPVSPKKQKKSPQGTSRVQKSPNMKDSGGIISHDELSGSSQDEPLETGKADLAKKKNLDCSGSSKDQDAQIVHLKSPNKCTYNTQIVTNLNAENSEVSVLEESGPSQYKNCLTPAKNNSDMDNKVQESSDSSPVKRSKVSPDKKMHYKLVLPSCSPNVRRTKRTRLRPLEYWRGERVDYHRRSSGGFVIGGILSPDIVPSKRKAKENVGRVNKIANRKRLCLDSNERKNQVKVNLDVSVGDPLQPTEVKDPETREIIHMDLIRLRDTYQFFIEHGELRVYKTLDTPFFSTGKLVLGPREEKGKQHVGQDILVFYVSFGDLLCTLHETPYRITTGDSFYVPSGNYYNIRNLLNEESVLLFTQIKR